MLPLSDAIAFAHRLIEFHPDVLVTQDFHDSGGGFGADTGAKARELLTRHHGNQTTYQDFVERLKRDRTVYEAEAGFFPP
jgi:hypothetical protein